MTMATTTIRIDIAMLPDHFDRSRPSVVAEVSVLIKRFQTSTCDQL